jgi:hypothetical protein
MKYIIVAIIFLLAVKAAYSTDPIKSKSFFLSVEISYTFHDYIKQIEFKKDGHTGGLALMLGHRTIPVYAEYFYQTPISYRYRNNILKEKYQEIGIRYNMNSLHYLIPHGVDPYIGISLIQKNSQFTQEGVSDPGEILKSYSEKSYKPKFSLGVRMGSKNITLGIQYDYLPSSLSLSSEEAENLTIYNQTHMVSARIGIRLNNLLRNKIRCPRFNHKQKRTIKF